MATWAIGRDSWLTRVLVLRVLRARRGRWSPRAGRRCRSLCKARRQQRPEPHQEGVRFGIAADLAGAAVGLDRREPLVEEPDQLAALLRNLKARGDDRACRAGDGGRSLVQDHLAARAAQKRHHGCDSDDPEGHRKAQRLQGRGTHAPYLTVRQVRLR